MTNVTKTGAFSKVGMIIAFALQGPTSFAHVIQPRSSSISCHCHASSNASPQSLPTQQLAHFHPRRAVLSSLLSLTVSIPSLARASLLDDFGKDPTIINQQEPKTNKLVDQAVNKGKQVSNLEPNLRSNYYYPTNKVRYLPRIKKCSDSIPQAAEAIGNQDWEELQRFTLVAEDTILPMKLYVSSLTGGGTNVKVAFTKDMLNAVKLFEKNESQWANGVDKRDTSRCSSALEGMAEALLTYRSVGRLLGPDGGGDIPSVDEIRRSTKRFRGEGFEAKVKERDERIKAAAAVAPTATSPLTAVVK